MVLMTVGFSAAFAVALAFFTPVPTNTAHTTLTAQLFAGADDWGTGDERITLRHTGGQPLKMDITTIRIEINGAPTEISGAALGPPFDIDGEMNIGERWTHTTNIEEGAAVTVNMVSTAGSQAVISTLDLVAGRTVGISSPGCTPGVYVDIPFFIRLGDTSAAPESNARCDDGIEAVLAEVVVPPGSVIRLEAQKDTDAVPQWTDPKEGAAQDGVDATTVTPNRVVTYAMEDVLGVSAASTVTRIDIVARARIEGYSNDQFRLQACAPAGTCGATHAEDPSAVYQLLVSEVTGDVPPGPWTIPKIDTLEARISSRAVAGSDGTWHLDAVFADVTYDPAIAGATRFDTEVTFTGLAGAKRMEIGYRNVGTDAFQLYAWKPNQREWEAFGPPWASPAFTEECTNVPSSYIDAAGNLRLRIIDTVEDTTVGNALHIDYLRMINGSCP